MKMLDHPFFSVGFRPFFALAMLAGASLPVLWILAYAGYLPLPARLTAFQWHAHEMLYGFGWAVLGGFLLTSTKNWVNIRGYHGASLALLALAWLVERIGIALAGHLPTPLFLAMSNLYLGTMVVMIMATLIKHRANDSYQQDNRFFLVLLPLFIIAKNLLLTPELYHHGWAMTLGLFRMAFLIMLERTLTQFMKSIFQAEILRDKRLDMPIKVLAMALVFVSLMPAAAGASLNGLLALLLLVRFAFWKPATALKRLDVGIMHLGYLGIVGQLVIDGLKYFQETSWLGTVGIHFFTFGTMGLIIPAMLMRIAKGHTGRKVSFDQFDLLTLRIMILAFVLRIVLPQLAPALYLTWLALAAACWFACFTLLAWRYIPFLMQPRVDGK